MNRDLEYYLAVPHLLAVESVELPDGDWKRRAEYPELPNCWAEADSAIDAMEQVDAQRVEIIKGMLERGEPVPVPRPPLLDEESIPDSDRLAFARWLVDQKRLSEQLVEHQSLTNEA